MSDVQATVNALANAMYQEMLEDVIMDIGQRTHKSIARTKAVCDVCHSRCRAESHIPNAAISGLVSALSSAPPRSTTPLSVKSGGTGNNGTDTPASKDKADVLLDCQNCKRQIASNRYAPHLASCLGLGTGTRRSNPRNNGKAKLTAENSRANSPTVGAASDEPAPPPTPARKGRPPKNSTPKKAKGKAGLGWAAGQGQSPSTSPIKGQSAGSASPTPSSKTLPTTTTTTHANYPKIPSRLRASSTTSTNAPSASFQAASPSGTGGADMDMDVDARASSYSPSQSQARSETPDSSGGVAASGSKGMKTTPGKSAPPGYVNPRGAAPITVTSHNDPDYVAVDGDDLVDTDSSEDGEDDD